MSAVRFSRWLMLLPALLLSACGSMPSPNSADAETNADFVRDIPQATPPTAAESALAPEPAPAEIVQPDPNAPKLSLTQDLGQTLALRERLTQVATPLLLSNIDLCKGHVMKILGFSARNAYSYSPQLANIARRSLGLTEALTVYDVLPDTGAYRAGLQNGDVLVAIDGQRLPKGKDALQRASNMIAPLLVNADSVTLDILRNGAPQTLSVPLTRSCGFRVDIGNASNIAAYDDGYRILVTRGVMGFAKTDTELANMVAKQMAHALLQNGLKLANNKASARLIDALEADPAKAVTVIGRAGIRPMSAKMDADADVLSLWMLLHAADTIDQSLAFWQRLAATVPASVENGYTALHPDTAARLAAIAQAIKAFNAPVDPSLTLPGERQKQR